MKNIFKILILAVAVTSFSSCIKEVFPEDGTVTMDRVVETPIDTRVLGLHSWMNKEDVLGAGDHNDFGYPALIIRQEMMGQDLLIPSPLYGWWDTYRDLYLLTYEYTTVQMTWRWYYRLIEMANSIIAGSPAYTDIDDEDKPYLGMAYAYRAFAYFDLARIYIQGRYLGNEDAPTVPKVTEKTTPAEAANNPRAKASDIYELILDDLTIAEECLGESIAVGPLPYLPAVEGMLARVHLEMGEWELAEQYASYVIGYGFEPLTEVQWSDRAFGFNKPNDAWVWWIAETANDDVAKTGIVCWPAHISNEAGYGYTGAGEFVAISSHLYSLIPTTDFRRNSYVNWDEGIVDSDFYYAEDWDDYTSLKFRPGSGEQWSYLIGNAVSIPLMRVEEMMLIEAEAAGRQTVADGVALLNDFVQTYRDSAYECTADNLDDFIDAVWLQRRIELWGEGFSSFDLKRLNKPAIRSYEDTNYQPGERMNTTGYPTWLDLQIPRTEINANDGISVSDNNPAPENPGDSPEYVW